MSDRYNQENNISSTVQQPQQGTTPIPTPVQVRAQYLQKLHAQAMILYRELSKRVEFLDDYINYAQYLIDSNPDPWERGIVLNSAQTLLNNILDLDRSAELLAGLNLQPGFEDLQKLDTVALATGEVVRQIGWMYLGRDTQEVQDWMGEAEGLLAGGKRAVILVEETIGKVERQARDEGIVIEGSI